MNPVIQDLRFSLRLMRKQSGTTLLVIITLVLGIGVNAAIFSVLNAVLLRPLPVFQPDRIVWLHSKVNQTGAPRGTSYPAYLDWKSQSRSFEAITAMYSLSFTLTGAGPAQHVKAAGISASGFKVWGVTPVLGRDFTDDDDRAGAKRVVILSHPFWQRKFGGDPKVLGKSLVLDDQQYIIIGVLQPTPLAALNYADVYVANGPLINSHLMQRDTGYFFPVARLKSHITLAQAQAEMETIASRLAAQYPATDKDMGVGAESMAQYLTADGRKPLSLLIVASTLIFLLASVNVMTVFMGNTVERTQELGLRLALGARRSSLLRQLFIQAFLYAFAGGIFGLVFAKLTLAFFLNRFPDAFIRFQETTIDLPVLLVTIIMSILASMIATLLPALYASKVNVGGQLAGDRSSFALPKYRFLGRISFIVFEVSMASVLSLLSGLLIKSLFEVQKVDLGFNPSHVFSFQVNPPAMQYNQPAQQAALYQIALERLAALPGMRSSSAIANLPLITQGWLNTLEVDQQSPLFGQRVTVEDESILPGLFQTMGLPILAGRDFTDADRDGTPPVVIVDNVLAQKLWPNRNPLGKHFRMSFLRRESSRWLEVVGVVRQIKHNGPERNTRWMQLYVPQYQDPSPVMSFVINTTLPESTVKASAEKALHEIDKDLPIESFESMQAYLDTALSARKLSLFLLSIFAAIGITLTATGVYGAVSDSVVRRRHEIAIRMALGATPSKAIILVTRLGLLATAAGIAIGSAIVVTLTRLLTSLLYGVSAFDPVVHLSCAAILTLLAILASAIPAARLLRFNIREILRP